MILGWLGEELLSALNDSKIRTCPQCRGKGMVPVPSLDDVNFSRMAEKTGISRSHLSRIFSEDPEQRRYPSMDVAKKICSYLGITLDDFARILMI